MTTPLAASNARVKEARKLSRRPERSGRRLFLADGPKAVEGALGVEDCVIEVFATPAATDRYADLLGTTTVTLVDDRALASLSTSVSPAGIVAVCRFLDVDPDALVEGAGAGTVVVCADVRDPGNAGTIIRTADAAGVGGVVLAGHSVDPYNDKTVRATVGSLFRLPVAIEPDPGTAVRRLQAAGHTVLAADGAGEHELFDPTIAAALDGPVAWLFGNEAWGLPDELAALADRRVRIPIAGAAESLNLSTAAAVCLFEGLRIRRSGAVTL